MAPAVMHIEAASTLAVIASSNEPLLFLSSELRLIAASASFCRSFQIDPESVPGRALSELGDGEWAVPQLASLLKATANGSAAIEAYEFDLARTGQLTRNLVVNARRLEDGDSEHIRLLLAVTDVTDFRAETRHKDELIREKAILLQEVQHRVANSLQIIASVLMQSARRVQSQEARGHLQDAHHRVMSIAAVQRQLAASSLGDVMLRPYLMQLCESLGASMIHDPKRLTIVATIDDSIVGATASVSLGLIVTRVHARVGTIDAKLGEVAHRLLDRRPQLLLVRCQFETSLHRRDARIGECHPILWRKACVFVGPRTVLSIDRGRTGNSKRSNAGENGCLHRNLLCKVR